MQNLPATPRVLWIALGAALLGGCTTVGPDFHTPRAPSVQQYTREALPAQTASAPGTLGGAQRFQTVERIAPDWWRVYGSSRLDSLVDAAQRSSPTLAAAEATLRQAQQTYQAQAGSTLYPTVNGKLGANRNQTNAASVGQSSSATNIFNLYNASIAVNYNFDLFGGNRRALEALAAQADYQQYQLQGAKLTLAANVVTAAFTQAQLGAQIDATETILKAQQNQLDIARKRFALGAAARTDVLTLETQVEQTRASVPPLRNKLEQTDHLLAVLLGQAPGAADIPRFTLADFTLPQTLPVVVPSALVQQRPDVQASQALLHAATAQYGVAVSNLYPQINLSASLGTQALTMGALFGPGSAVWSLAGSLAQPLFNAGLKAGANAAEASLQAAGANYQQTVLQALRNVADALRALDNDAQTLQAQAAADTAAQESLKLVDQQYLLGAASYLQLLTAQQQAQQTRIGLISAQAQRLADSAALYQAMGGGVLDEQSAPVAAASASK
ncbi:putative RND efflux system outer membrane lipoprotein NodT [Thiomonas arsenitoxydans]|uniref:RND efflux system outer membrane lipoprotein NodT n=1 Tax=Thiomonas arsenitoxydans (strain DSM 22701 / CIP 110005 / 3As) TaxID=426114 RepID=D6CN26_THIA3|nr:efflux transporter outer membrane subunit [Thiomonas arsenitoxydans]CAZ89954.1 putative RND efflux system outer membrane lipoprotein NodT [Thiomonas arsenitoxydans]CQR37589.1 putative RND efflux system outer membrane lipoprotein NodT [Thiomonas arsenitoxydans]CQR38571.1 putative RND efflux system outer membrane lipoprotein NodT [Thiomonas arsenitoxydans]CQR39899.1 putative RND efflux system outer membrane lipoprotein NodT [Thiomonas arsenitoxydans]CQR40076.1 putative RND efflux system outer